MGQGLLASRNIDTHWGNHQHSVVASTQELQPVGRSAGWHLKETQWSRGTTVPLAQREQGVSVTLAAPTPQRHQETVHTINHAVATIVEIGWHRRTVNLIGTIAGDNYGRHCPSEQSSNGHRLTTGWTQRVVTFTVITLNQLVTLARRDIIHQFASHRHL